MKTPILRKYESRLAEVNNQLCYCLFSDAEVEAHLKEVAPESETAFTTDIFPENKYSEMTGSGLSMPHSINYRGQ